MGRPFLSSKAYICPRISAPPFAMNVSCPQSAGTTISSNSASMKRPPEQIGERNEAHGVPAGDETCSFDHDVLRLDTSEDLATHER